MTLTTHQAQASHAIGSDMNYVNVGPNLYLVTYRFYRDCSGITGDASVTLNAAGLSCATPNGTSAGNPTQLFKRNIEDGNPYCGRVLSTQQPCDTTGSVSTPFPNYQVWSYSGIVSLPVQCSEWKLSVAISARPSIGNLDTEGNLFSLVRLNNRDVQDDSSPAFSIAPGFKPLIFVCDSSTNTVGNAVNDPDGDSLVYSLAPALNADNSPEAYSPGYTFVSPVRRLLSPNDSVFGQPIIPFQVDPQTGTIAFTAGANSTNTNNENEQNKFVVVVQIDAYRKVAGQIVRTGSVRRDILVVIFPCIGLPQSPSVPGGDSVVTNPGVDTTLFNSRFDTINVDACNSSRIEFPILDVNGDSVFAQIDTTQLPGGATLQIVRQQLAGVIRIATARLIWVPNDSTVGGEYPITINIRDNGCPVPTQNSIRLLLRVTRNSYAGVGLFTRNNNGQNDTLCVGQVTRLVATTQRPATIGYPPRPATYQYIWLQDADSSIVRTNRDTAIVRPRKTTRYKLEVVSPQGCIDTASIVVIVDPLNRATSIPDSICPGQTAQLQVNGRTRQTGPDGRPIVYTFRWKADSTLSDTTIANPTATPPGTRRYFATVFSSLGCTDTSSVVVFNKGAYPAFDSTQNAVQQYRFGRPLTYGQNGVPSLAATNDDGRFTYRIRGKEFLNVFSDTTSATPTVNGLTRTTKYTLVSLNALGCEARRTFTIEVPVNIPNIITPNGDNLNDLFVVEGIGEMEVTIFNRWGAKVEDFTNYQNNWTAKDAPAGTYYYLVREKTGGKTYKGWVEVVK